MQVKPWPADKYGPVCHIKGRFVTGRLKLKLKTINRLIAQVIKNLKRGLTLRITFFERK